MNNTPQLTNAVSRYNKIILAEMKEAKITCWIAGGALRDYFMGVPIKTDLDVFFPNETEYQKAEVYFKAKDAKIIWESDNGMKVSYKGRKFDLVKKFFDTPRATIDAFDFTVSMFAVDSDSIYYGSTSFIDLAKRQLMINKITYPASTISRAFRYYKKGFSMCQGEMKKMCEAMQSVPKDEQENDSGKDDAPSGDDETTNFFIGID